MRRWLSVGPFKQTSEWRITEFEKDLAKTVAGFKAFAERNA